MEPQQAQGLSYGGPGSSAEVGNRASSIAAVARRAPRAMPRGHGAAAAPHGAAAASHGPSGLTRSRAQGSSHMSPQPSPTGASRSSAEPASSSEYSHGIPHWRRDAVALDIEAGCAPWTYGGDNRTFPWLPCTLFGSRLEHKVRDPALCDSVHYDTRPPSPMKGFICHFLLFFAYCGAISLFNRRLRRIGIYCGHSQSESFFGPNPVEDVEGPSEEPSESLAILWAETLVTTGACFLLAQGYYGIRAARERMERVKQTTVTLAYSFMKTSTVGGVGHGKDELQILIYECLALLTEYPVALLEQMRGNTCEPAIAQYCHDVSRALKRLRDGDDSIVAGHLYRREPWVGRGSGHPRFVTVEYFFEIFSLQLQLEFSRQSMRTKVPSMTSQHILYNLRNHFENFVDLGNLDDRRTPIIRENIDMLGLAGRECSIFALIDVIPLAFLWSTHLAGWLIALYCLVQNCERLVSWPHDDDEEKLDFPTMELVLPMAVLALLSAMLTTVLAEMWQMWGPFDKGTNTHAWTLGIANEIDNMLNEFYEYDTKGLVRKHAYMDTSAYLDDMGLGSCGSSGNRAQTV